MAIFLGVLSSARPVWRRGLMRWLMTVRPPTPRVGRLPEDAPTRRVVLNWAPLSLWSSKSGVRCAISVHRGPRPGTNSSSLGVIPSPRTRQRMVVSPTVTDKMARRSRYTTDARDEGSHL